ncbi:MAG: urea transporter [Calditrichia bacterium]
MAHQTAILSQNVGWVLLAILSHFLDCPGHLLGQKAKDMEGFMLAGRNVGLALGAATAMATWVTSNTTMLAPQFALQLGVWGMLAYSTASFGLFMFAPLAKRIKGLMPTGYTSGDFIRLRYGKRAWLLFLIISIFYGVTWMISMGMAGGILMNAITGIPYVYGMSVILLVCVIYTLFGGLYAVIGTDFIQSLIILIGIVAVGAGILMNTDMTQVHTDLQKTAPCSSTSYCLRRLWHFLTTCCLVSAKFFIATCGGAGFSRCGRMWDESIFVGRIILLPVPVAAGYFALSSGILGINITSPDMVSPLIASQLLGEIGSVIVFVVLFCSLASSIDSLLAATSDLVTEDIYKKWLRPDTSPEKLRKMSAWIIVFIGVLTWLICLPRVGTLADVLFFAGPMVGSTIWPIVTGLYWRKASATGAFWGMLLGSLCGLVSYFELGWYTSSLIGAAVSMIVVIIARVVSKTSFDWKDLNEASNH